MSNLPALTRSKDNAVGKYILVLSIACIGSFLQITGVSWDVTSHLMLTPETFFTPSHMLLYCGVGLLVVAAAIGAILMLTGQLGTKNPVMTPFRLFIVGSMLAAIAGPSDYAWHKTFGVDGLLSPTHLVLATGIIINSVSVVLGLGRVAKQVHSAVQKKVIKLLMIPAFSAMWLTMIWYIYLFALPLSNGLHFNFNLNPVIESIIAIAFLPVIDAVVLLIAVRTIDMKWSATAIITVVIMINSFTNIIPSVHLVPFLPLYLSLIIAAFLYDFIIHKSGVHATGISKERSFIIVSAMIGSVFYILGYPLLPITFAEPLGLSFHSMSDLYVDFVVTLPIILLFTLPFGAFMGAVSAMWVLKMDIARNSEEHIGNPTDSRLGRETS